MTRHFGFIMAASIASTDDIFELYDLRVEVVVPKESMLPSGDPPRLLCGAEVGDHFTLEGEMLYLPPGQGISIYSLGKKHQKRGAKLYSLFVGTTGLPRRLEDEPATQSNKLNSIARFVIASVLPLLAAKQRPTHTHDWMTSDAEVACPDPHCPSRLRIIRTGLRTFSHGETTVVPLHSSH